MNFYKIILAGFLIILPNIALAEKFMLPKSFSISENDLPEIEMPAEPVKTSAKKTAPANVTLENIEDYVITDLSLTDLIRNFNYPYSKTLNSTMAALSQFDIQPVFYDSSKGQIRAKLKSGKEIFILLLPSQDDLTHVRITPTDGQYDLSKDLINDIFKNIDRNLYSNVD